MNHLDWHLNGLLFLFNGFPRDDTAFMFNTELEVWDRLEA